MSSIQSCDGVGPHAGHARVTRGTTILVRNRECARAVARELLRRLKCHEDVDAWHALGATLLLLGDRMGAIVAFRTAIGLDQGHVDSRLALGNLLFDSGQCERALRFFGLVESYP
jgi:hypothetical protein